MDKGTSSKERSARVEQVLQELGLRKCEDTRIGVPGRVKGRETLIHLTEVWSQF